MNEEVTSKSFESHLDALGHPDRRRLLLALLDASAEDALPIEIDRLIHDTAEDDLRVSIYHIHLPKLKDHGFVDANLEDRTVTAGPRFEELRPLLELLETNREQLPYEWLSDSQRQQLRVSYSGR